MWCLRTWKAWRHRSAADEAGRQNDGVEAIGRLVGNTTPSGVKRATCIF
jgi:hypothetical protein